MRVNCSCRGASTGLFKSFTTLCHKQKIFLMQMQKNASFISTVHNLRHCGDICGLLVLRHERDWVHGSLLLEINDAIKRRKIRRQRSDCGAAEAKLLLSVLQASGSVDPTKNEAGSTKKTCFKLDNHDLHDRESAQISRRCFLFQNLHIEFSAITLSLIEHAPLELRALPAGTPTRSLGPGRGFSIPVFTWEQERVLPPPLSVGTRSWQNINRNL